MALPVGSQFDLNRIPVLGFVPEQGGTAPANPVEGLFWNDSTNKVIKVYLNGAWTTLGTAGAGGPPSGAAGGDLTGSYPNPTIQLLAVGSSKLGNDAVTTLKIQNTAVTLAKLNNALVPTWAGGSGLATDLNVRRIGTTGEDAMAGNTTLNGIPIPVNDVSMDGYKLISLGAPVAPSDAANKSYVDSVAQGLDAKPSVKVATTTSIGGGGIPGGVQTIDGYTTGTGDRVLVKNQSLPQNNGIYGTNTGGSWNRVADLDTWAEAVSAFVFVEQGTVNADTGWVSLADAGGTIGTTNMPWSQFSGGGSLIAGAGLTQTGNVFDVVGTANRIVANADSVDIASNYVGQSSITTLGTVTTGVWNGTTIAIANGGTGATTAAGARTALGTVGKYAVTLGALTAGVETTITHNLNSTDVQAMFRDATSNNQILLSWRPLTVNTAGVTADVAYGANAVKAVVMG